MDRALDHNGARADPNAATDRNHGADARAATTASQHVQDRHHRRACVCPHWCPSLTSWLLAVLSLGNTVAALFFLFSVPGRVLVIGQLVLVPLILLVTARAAWTLSHGSRQQHGSTSPLTSPSPNSVPRGLRVFGLDPAAIPVPTSDSADGASSHRLTRTASSSSTASTSSAPRQRHSIERTASGSRRSQSLGSRRIPTRESLTSTSDLVRGMQVLSVDADGNRGGQRTATKSAGNQQRRSTATSIVLILNVALQVTLMGLTLAAVFGPWLLQSDIIDNVEFARLGHVNATHATITARLRPDRVPAAGADLGVTFRASNGTTEWQRVDGTIQASGDTDYTATVHLRDLDPATEYEYRIAPAAGNDGTVWLTGRVRTFPRFSDALDTTKSLFTFVAGSCVKPSTPWATETGIRGFRVLADHVKPDLMLFLGDFIYSDVPWWFPPSLATYRWHYRFTYSVDETRRLLAATPSYFVYDDHEFSNNWDNGEHFPFPVASQAYNEYLGGGNPRTYGATTQYYHFTLGPACFFVTDLRRYRTTPDAENPTILGAQQWADLEAWFQTPNCTWRIVAASVPVTNNWAIDKDTWVGYPRDRTRLLDLAHRANGTTVIVSGDRHAVGIQRLKPYGEVVELSISPVSQFYSPIPFYGLFVKDEDRDEVLFERSKGNVQLGVFDVFVDRIAFRLLDGEGVEQFKYVITQRKM
ncbi:hypothetical protein AMAG_10561 [Allomyces macrogynus ATCC 38327]|uniref:PhoD-like phosphatase metallophosphatase domain-containing protein n=1 Tax=Allomyces macrogynus (strain ATCC 38327) TaxID=578462 RepID=A0A0L0SQS1_ALLM3|nr:hypothetical protein AMAG_10561 [Allomyces macrogynus ATCC 38327]|eukprot:KNE64888.1 hypothetical protein AMAG_10561 [Allomyces macrogynus ATCC 38327]